MLVVALLMVALWGYGPALAQDSGAGQVGASAVLTDASGQQVGTVRFEDQAGQGTVLVTVQVQNMAPGFQELVLTSVGQCDATGTPPYSSAGDPLNLNDQQFPFRAGDLLPVFVMQNGTGQMSFVTDRFTTADLLDNDGSAVVVRLGASVVGIPLNEQASQTSGDQGQTGQAAIGVVGQYFACGVVNQGDVQGTAQGEGQSQSAGGSAAQGAPITVSLIDGKIEMPASIPGGSVTFQVTNNGTLEHSLVIEGVDNPGFSASLDHTLQPGQSATLQVDLAPGTYRVYCPVDSHADKGMLLELTVTQGAEIPATPQAGAAGGSAAQGEPITVSLIDGKIEMPASITGGSVTFQVTNNGTLEHSLVIEGVDNPAFSASLDHTLQPGQSATLQVELAPGAYKAYCPVDDHIDLGMLLDLTVTEPAQ